MFDAIALSAMNLVYTIDSSYLDEHRSLSDSILDNAMPQTMARREQRTRCVEH